MNEMKIHDLWPHPIYENIIDYDVEPLKDKILSYIERGNVNTPNWQCKVQTSFSQHELNQELFADLYPVITEKLNEFAKRIGVIQYADEEMKITEMWFNYYPNGHWQEKHTHPGSSISGVFYLTYDECGTLFYNPNLIYLHTDNVLETGNQYNRFAYRVLPEPSKLCMFRSYMTHGVEIDTEDRQYSKQRLTLAFNSVMIKNDRRYNQ